MNILRKIKIKYRLLIIFFLVSIIPILILGIFSYQVYTRSVREKINDSTNQSFSLISNTIDTEISKYQHMIGLLSIDPQIQSYLKISETPETLGKSAKIIDAIVNKKFIYPQSVKNIRILTTQGKIFYDLGYDNISPDQQEAVVHDIGKQSPNDSWSYARSFRKNDMIIIGRRMIDIDDYKTKIGYIMFFLDEETFRTSILGKEPNIASLSFIDYNGTILSSTEPTEELGNPYNEGKAMDEIYQAQLKGESSFECIVDGSNSLVSFMKVPKMNAYLLSRIPYSYIYSEMHLITNVLAVVVVITILVSVLLVFELYRSIMNPLNAVVSSCKSVAEGDFSVRLSDQSSDEVSILSGNMDFMTVKIEDLLEQQKNEEKSKRKLELRMLQYQINPHFLFNTLNTLKWIAVINKEKTLSDGIGALSELLKSTIVNADEFVTVEDEIYNLKNYFEIQKIRYADGFEVKYNLDNSLIGYKLPKFILQPMAENAIIHGIGEDVMTIEIRCLELDEQNIQIEIKDNGVGFDDSQIEDIKAIKVTKIGINNVDERLRLAFGHEYGVMVTSQPGIGTTCKIKVPKKSYEMR